MNVTAARTNDVKLQTLALTSDYCVRFFYHMYGADIGDLFVQTLSGYNNVVTTYFHRSRSQGDRWKEVTIYVTTDRNMRYYGYRVSSVWHVNHSLAGVVI